MDTLKNILSAYQGNGKLYVHSFYMLESIGVFYHKVHTESILRVTFTLSLVSVQSQ